MKPLTVLLVLLPCLLCACSSVESLTSYESDELIEVQHNRNSDCTLLIYRDPMGQLRHVFRRHGIFEFGLTFRADGGITLKERGRMERDIEAMEASQVTQRINTLMSVQKSEQRAGRLSNRSI